MEHADGDICAYKESKGDNDSLLISLRVCVWRWFIKKIRIFWMGNSTIGSIWQSTDMWKIKYDLTNSLIERNDHFIIKRKKKKIYFFYQETWLSKLVFLVAYYTIWSTLHSMLRIMLHKNECTSLTCPINWPKIHW